MPRAKKKAAEPVATVENSGSLACALGLGQGIGGGINPIGFPGNQGAYGSVQLSQSTTIFKNLRWYLISNFRQMLSQAYVEIGLIQTIVDVPVDDAFRGGIDIKSKQLDETEIETLQVSIDRDNDLVTIGQAAKWNRLYGGAGIIIFTDQDPETPLDISQIGPEDDLEFRAADLWELFWDKQNTDGYDPSLQSENFEFYSYYGTRVHKSRVMKLVGMTAPSFIRPRLLGWGFSVVETLVRSINQYLKATDLAFEVLDEFKLDVYKMKNLVNTLLSGPQGEERVRKRVQLANFQKNYQNAMVMDSEDDFDHKQLSFSGLAETMGQIRMQVASDMRMPLTKLFGISAAGFNSGEDDLEVYNAMIESQVRNKIKFDVLRVLEIKCQKLFGYIPDDLSVSFKPLRLLSAEQEENVRTQKFNRAIQAKTAGEISSLEFRDICNKGNLFDIKLDTTADDAFDPDSGETVGEEPGRDPEDDIDTDDPGTSRSDSRKVVARAKGGGPKGAVKPKPVKNAEWDEKKHPRADDGKFGEGGGGSGDTGKKSSGRVKPSDVVTKVSLSHQETVALRDYKRRGSVLVNTYLRSPDTAKVSTSDTERPATDAEKKQAASDIKKIDKVFSRSKLSVDTTVYRGLQSKQMTENPDSMVGETFQDPAYLSTTTNPGFASFHSGIVEKNRVQLNIKAKAGTPAINMEQMGDAYTGESEVLLPRGTKLKITSFKKTEQGVVFEAEVVSDTLKNSAEFDRASYEADGGDDWMDPRREAFFSNPGNKDEGLWARAKEASQKAFGHVRWRFIVWWYQKQGGKFG